MVVYEPIDVEIAQSLGYRVNGVGLSELAELNAVLERISTLRTDFEVLLDEELSNIERDGMRTVAKENSFHSLSEAITGEVNLLTHKAYTFIDVRATEQDTGDLLLELLVNVYTGKYNIRAGLRAPKDRSDANHLKRSLERLGKISLDSVDGLYLERQGYPRITSLQPPVKSPAGSSIHSTHVVNTIYTALIPADMLPKVYSKHMDLLTPG